MRGIALDLSTEVWRAVVFRLLEAADASPGSYIAESPASAPMDPWAGPPGYDAVVQAMCGLGSVNGDRASGPLRMGVPIVDLSTGLSTSPSVWS